MDILELPRQYQLTVTDDELRMIHNCLDYAVKNRHVEFNPAGKMRNHIYNILPLRPRQRT